MSYFKLSAKNIQANLVAGVLTMIPIVVVWIVVDFILAFLSSVGAPLAHALSSFIVNRWPELAPIIADPVLQWLVGVVVALLLIFTIGAAASQMLGRRLIGLFEALIERIPFVHSVYSATKKLVGVLQQKPNGSSRVVLVEFPHPGMKAIGLVMRTMRDARTGEDIAVVYVPTAPNPTSGYLEFVPVKNLVPTDMSMDQAMTMIVSGGAVAPANLSTTKPL